MPLSHVRTFPVRHYECDACGYLAAPCYLRYMQETAFDASAAAGYDTTRYQEMQRSWLIRETDIEFLVPLRYGDSVEVKTWVADFRRVRSRRAYELRLASSGDLAASALTDWAFMDIASDRPAAIPSDLVAAFIPEGMAELGLPRVHLAVPEPSRRAFRMRRQVEWGDLDPGRHVNNAVFVGYIEECALRAAAEDGWPPERMHREGFQMVPRRHHVEYLQPAVLYDELELTTWPAELDDMTVVRYCTIAAARTRAELVRSRTQWACRELGNGQLVPLPRVFRQVLAP